MAHHTKRDMTLDAAMASMSQADAEDCGTGRDAKKTALKRNGAQVCLEQNGLMRANDKQCPDSGANV